MKHDLKVEIAYLTSGVFGIYIGTSTGNVGRVQHVEEGKRRRYTKTKG